jgi:hypothetical protein
VIRNLHGRASPWAVLLSSHAQSGAVFFASDLLNVIIISKFFLESLVEGSVFFREHLPPSTFLLIQFVPIQLRGVVILGVKDLGRGIIEERVSVRVHHEFGVIGLDHPNGHDLLNAVILFVELGKSVFFRVNHKVMLNLVPTIIFFLLSCPHHVCDVRLHFWFVLEVPEETRMVRAEDPGFSSERVRLFSLHGLIVDDQASLNGTSDMKSFFAFVGTLIKINQVKAYRHSFLD